MKKPIFLFLFTVLSMNCYAQITFEAGYYINNAGDKIEGLIKNVGWQKNPKQIEFKQSENAKQQKLTIDEVKEFGINYSSKYIRRSVNIDLSSDQFPNLSTERELNLQNRTLFLKVLVEGQANLYAYSNGNLSRFFFNENDSPIEQLIFKKYLTSENTIAINDGYKHQLWSGLNSSCVSVEYLKSLDFKEKKLVNLFTNYHQCIGAEFSDFEKKGTKGFFNINLRPGLQFSSLSINNTMSSVLGTDFENELSFRFGVEAEFVLPFNKNKWAILIEPSYQSFTSDKTTQFGTTVASIDYQSLEFPLGVRHYFFLNNNSKIFINSSVVLDFPLKSNISLVSFSATEIQTPFNYAFGLGYKYKENYSLELRYFTNRDIFFDFAAWENDYNTLAIIFGYTLFSTAQ